MNEFMLKDEKLKNLIYEIRGIQVMLDSDLARLYECKNGTKQINLAVKRHKDKFPAGVAAQVSIRIMDAFVLFRKYISSNLMEQKYINDLVLRNHEKLEILETYFEKLEEKRKVVKYIFMDKSMMLIQKYKKFLHLVRKNL